jgi:P-type Ca2+ transporter type 2C
VLLVGVSLAVAAVPEGLPAVLSVVLALAFHGLFTNRWLWAAVTVSLALQVAVVHAPALNDAFDTTPLTFGEWAICTGLASAVLAAGEARKLAARSGARR